MSVSGTQRDRERDVRRGGSTERWSRSDRERDVGAVGHYLDQWLSKAAVARLAGVSRRYSERA